MNDPGQYSTMNELSAIFYCFHVCALVCVRMYTQVLFVYVWILLVGQRLLIFAQKSVKKKIKRTSLKTMMSFNSSLSLFRFDRPLDKKNPINVYGFTRILLQFASLELTASSKIFTLFLLYVLSWKLAHFHDKISAQKINCFTTVGCGQMWTQTFNSETTLCEAPSCDWKKNYFQTLRGFIK